MMTPTRVPHNKLIHVAPSEFWHVKRGLKQRLPLIMVVDEDALEDLGWLRLTESSFAFWTDAEEDIYNDLISSVSAEPKA